MDDRQQVLQTIERKPLAESRGTVDSGQGESTRGRMRI
jgi:hypothetical protein